MITVPKRDELMLPLLFYAREQVSSDKTDVFNVKWSFNFLIEELDLSKNVFDEKIKSGGSKFESNVRWAIKYLKEAKLLKSVDRGYYEITARGLDVLEEKPRKIDTKYLMTFREFREYLGRKYKKDFVPDDQSRLM